MRAPRSRNAALNRSRFSGSRAGVMSASAVTRGNPCNRAARAPMSTNRTWCLARVVMIRSGSSGAGLGAFPRALGKGVGYARWRGRDAGTVLATARGVPEATDVADFVEPLLGREAQDAGDGR